MKKKADLSEQIDEQLRRIAKLLEGETKQRFYTYKQAAALLGLKVTGLKSRLRRGQIKKVSNLRKPFIADSEIKRFLKEQNS